MFLRSFCAILICSMAAPLAAEDNNATDADRELAMEEIIVTAGFTDGLLMDTPGSTSVVAEATIGDRAGRHLEDVLLAVPNVTISAGGSRARFIQMRGIGDLEQFVDPKHFPSVGVVLDGIEFSNVATGALLFDAEQVEVLRGPQGTRFGAAALAGMVNVRGRSPGDEFEAEISSGYGNLDTWHVSAAAGGPIGDTARARIALRQFSSDGFQNNAFLGRDDTQDKDELSARLKFEWDVSERVDASLTTFYVDADNGYDAFSLDNVRTTQTDEPGRDDQRIAAVGGRIGVAISDNHRVELLSTYVDSAETYSFDEDWVFGGFCDGVRCPPAFEFTSTDRYDRDREQVTVDLRWLGSFGHAEFVTGAYYHHREEALDRFRFGLFESDYETNRYALYGQSEFSLNESLSLRLGIRGESFDDEYGDSGLLGTQSNDTYWSGEATLTYRHQSEALVYFTAARGAKPGGFNTSAASVVSFIAPRFQTFIGDRLRFDTETLFNKELGLKMPLLDGRAALRVAAFHTDRSNAQLESFVWDATTFLFVGVLNNVDDAENYGVELELDWALTDALEFTARAGWLETNVESMTVFDLDLDDFRQLRDRDQTKAPEWSYHFGLRWQALPALTAALSVEGQTGHFFGYYHDGRLDGYALMNLALNYRYKQAEIRAWARNLLNTEYAVHGLFFANDPRDGFAVNRTYTQFGEPRVYGVELSWNY